MEEVMYPNPWSVDDNVRYWTPHYVGMYNNRFGLNFELHNLRRSVVIDTDDNTLPYKLAEILNENFRMATKGFVGIAERNAKLEQQIVFLQKDIAQLEEIIDVLSAQIEAINNPYGLASEGLIT